MKIKDAKVRRSERHDLQELGSKEKALNLQLS